MEVNSRVGDFFAMRSEIYIKGKVFITFINYLQIKINATAYTHSLLDIYSHDVYISIFNLPLGLLP
jgi:hypothetical protein